MKDHSEATIIKALRSYFQNGYNYRIENAFIFSWECDFFCTNRDHYSFEFEVKISRSDFKNDLKKKKHEYLNSGIHPLKAYLPNRFYYAVPKGLVSVSEVPSYAGLIYVDGFVSIEKRAPFIHKNKHDYRRILCDKFYHRWIEQRRENGRLSHEHDMLKKRVERFEVNALSKFNITQP